MWELKLGNVVLNLFNFPFLFSAVCFISYFAVQSSVLVLDIGFFVANDVGSQRSSRGGLGELEASRARRWYISERVCL
jgi:hypothetical protein